MTYSAVWQDFANPSAAITTPPPTIRPRPRSWERWLPLLLALAGALAYANSLTGPFVYDDLASIPGNRSIRHLATAFWPDHGAGQTVESRPVLNLTLALNYAFGGLEVRGYHLANVLIHVLAGLALYGFIRRTLRLPLLISRFGEDASLLAGSISLLWIVHPLQTEAVDYVIQRAESLVGLFFLFTFYAFVRATQDGTGPGRAGRLVPPSPTGGPGRAALPPDKGILRPCLWRVLCIASFVLGLGTKEIMAVALPLLWLYDGILISGNLIQAWRAHRGLYLALASSLLFLVALIASEGGNRSGTIGLGFGGSFLGHVLTQPLALLTYLKLSLIPSPLVFEYGVFQIHPGGAFYLQAAVILGLLTLMVIALKRWPPAGFAAAWFFLILAPTSLAPQAGEVIVEHRMYLPLAAVLSLIVFGLYRRLGRKGLFLLLIPALALGGLTAQRNDAYRTAERLWRDTVARRPQSDRARFGLGNALNAEGRSSEALAQYQEALRLDPSSPEAHNSIGTALEHIPGGFSDAVAQYEEALRLNPKLADAHYNLGNLLAAEGLRSEAIEQYRACLQLRPNDFKAHDNLAIAFCQEGRAADGVPEFEAALRLNPDDADLHNNLGAALTAEGRTREAILQYQEALRLRPDFPKARYALARLVGR